MQFKFQTVLYQAIQFSIITQFSSSWTIDRILSGATTSGQSGPGNYRNEEVLRIPQNISITGTSPSDFLVSYPLHSLVGLPLCKEAIGVFYSSSRLGEMQSGYSKTRQQAKQL